MIELAAKKEGTYYELHREKFMRDDMFFDCDDVEECMHEGDCLECCDVLIRAGHKECQTCQQPCAAMKKAYGGEVS